MRAMNRKKALAARRICSYRKRGRKVRTPYLVVLEAEREGRHYDHITIERSVTGRVLLSKVTHGGFRHTALR